VLAVDLVVDGLGHVDRDEVDRFRRPTASYVLQVRAAISR